LAHRANKYLAVVDLESYPSFIAQKADHLDLLSHLCRQVESLNAVMWETPSDTLNLTIRLTSSARMSHELTRTHRLVFDGCVRTTGGQLCLTDDETLLATSHRRKQDLLHGQPVPDTRCPQVIHVPPGVINVAVFCERSNGAAMPELDHARFDYTILMRHYPFPPPRVAPVRLTGGLIPWAGEEASEQTWGGRFAA
jgi:hypothetical protein